MTSDGRIIDGKVQYDINREAAYLPIHQQKSI